MKLTMWRGFVFLNMYTKFLGKKNKIYRQIVATAYVRG